MIINHTLQAIGIGLVVFVALVLLWRLRSNKSAPSPEFKDHVEAPIASADAFTGTPSGNQTDALEAEVRMLIDYGNKAEATRIVREKLGLDLKDANDLVDRMEGGAPLRMDDTTAGADTPTDADSELRQLVQDGHLIEAIKRVREQKGLDLKQAKAYVERL